MTHIRKITIGTISYLNNDRIELELPKENKPVHLIITGPNGCGKTTIMNLLAKELIENLQVKEKMETPITIDWEEPLHERFTKGLFISAFLKAMRMPEILESDGPKKLRIGPTLPITELSSNFLQFLVNRKADQGFAAVDNQLEKAEKLDAWFEKLLVNLRKLFGLPEMELEFDSKNYNFFLKHPDGRRHDFTQLADGHAAVLSIFAELLLRTNGMDRENGVMPHELPGVVLIDELETHLHLELQEKILPFLTEIFPNFQFIVATHSPVIIASVENSVVYDMETKKTNRGLDYKGVPYGAIMTGHFGIESDFDVDSTSKLKELALLNRKEIRTAEEDVLLQRLAEELSATSHPLALEVWNKIRYEKYYEKDKDNDTNL